MGGNHYSARVFDKKHITSSKDSLAMVRVCFGIMNLKNFPRYAW